MRTCGFPTETLGSTVRNVKGGLEINLPQGEGDAMEKQTPSVIPLNSIPADVLEMLGPPPLLIVHFDKEIEALGSG
jgi:hypothetical protein